MNRIGVNDRRKTIFAYIYIYIYTETEMMNFTNFNMSTNDKPMIHLLFPGVSFYPAVILLYLTTIIGVASSALVICVYVWSTYFRLDNPSKRVFVIYTMTSMLLLFLYGAVMIIILSVGDIYVIPTLAYDVTCTVIGIVGVTALLGGTLAYVLQAYDRVTKLTDPLRVDRHLKIGTTVWLLGGATIFSVVHAIFPVVFTTRAYSANPICLPFYSLHDTTSTPAVRTFICSFIFINVVVTLIDIILIVIIYRSIRDDIELCTTKECRQSKFGVLRKLTMQAVVDVVMVVFVVVVLILLPDSSLGLGLILATTSMSPIIDVYSMAFKHKTFLNEAKKMVYKRRLISVGSST